jgi:hypothetical protein
MNVQKTLLQDEGPQSKKWKGFIKTEMQCSEYGIQCVQYVITFKEPPESSNNLLLHYTCLEKLVSQKYLI